MTQPLADIGLIGLAVMGENFALNMESKGFRVAVYNRTTERVQAFLAERGRGKNFVGARTPAELVAALQKPRKILMLIKAGPAVDAVIDELLPLLDRGDHSHRRRQQPVHGHDPPHQAGRGRGHVCMSARECPGARKGALTGPSLMPGGSAAAWEHIKPIFQAVCARTPDGEPCCDWMGEDGAGHFVKMIHNGIEYGDMQLIAETYDVMKRVLGLSNQRMHDVFANGMPVSSTVISSRLRATSLRTSRSRASRSSM
jgi:6-phosphogluconate dehydrogenase